MRVRSARVWRSAICAVKAPRTLAQWIFCETVHECGARTAHDTFAKTRASHQKCISVATCQLTHTHTHHYSMFICLRKSRDSVNACECVCVRVCVVWLAILRPTRTYTQSRTHQSRPTNVVGLLVENADFPTRFLLISCFSQNGNLKA